MEEKAKRELVGHPVTRNYQRMESQDQEIVSHGIPLGVVSSLQCTGKTRARTGLVTVLFIEI